MAASVALLLIHLFVTLPLHSFIYKECHDSFIKKTNKRRTLSTFRIALNTISSVTSHLPAKLLNDRLMLIIHSRESSWKGLMSYVSLFFILCTEDYYQKIDVLTEIGLETKISSYKEGDVSEHKDNSCRLISFLWK